MNTKKKLIAQVRSMGKTRFVAAIKRKQELLKNTSIQPERKGKPLPYRVGSLTLHLENGTIADLARPPQKDSKSD